MDKDSGCIGIGMIILRLGLNIISTAWSVVILVWVVTHPGKLLIIWDWMWN